jgi:hypothetical protein
MLQYFTKLPFCLFVKSLVRIINYFSTFRWFVISKFSLSLVACWTSYPRNLKMSDPNNNSIMEADTTEEEEEEQYSDEGFEPIDLSTR